MSISSFVISTSWPMTRKQFYEVRNWLTDTSINSLSVKCWQVLCLFMFYGVTRRNNKINNKTDYDKKETQQITSSCNTNYLSHFMKRMRRIKKKKSQARKQQMKLKQPLMWYRVRTSGRVRTRDHDWFISSVCKSKAK